MSDTDGSIDCLNSSPSVLVGDTDGCVDYLNSSSCVSVGDTDGSIDGERLFRCAPKHGVVVALQNVLAFYSPKVGSIGDVVLIKCRPVDSTVPMLFILKHCWQTFTFTMLLQTGIKHIAGVLNNGHWTPCISILYCT